MGMMPTLVETVERERKMHCSREEAARMLEGLRAAYQSLSPGMRWQVTSHVEKLAQAQSHLEEAKWQQQEEERQEKECFESV